MIRRTQVARGLRSNHIQLLDWDTAFFRRRIGRALGSRFSPRTFRQMLAECRRHAVDCVYAEIDPSSARTIRLVEEQRFSLVDVRVRLSRDVKHRVAAVRAGVHVRTIASGDFGAVRRIAESCASASRFSQDPRLRHSVRKMYRIWIASLCAQPERACVLVAGRRAAAGFVACTLDGPAHTTGRIELICVDRRFAGRGIGAALIAGSLRWFANERARHVEVVTQARNVDALRLYERMGFTVRRTSLFYHGWLRSS